MEFSDIPVMMNSDQQARLALDFLRRTQVSRRVRRASDHADISPELFDRVLETISMAPDVRDDGMFRGAEETVESAQVRADADQMIGRLVSSDLA